MAASPTTKAKGQCIEGPQAAARFLAAVAHLAAVPPASAPRPMVRHRAKAAKKR